jgi:arylsulfatase A-like enzyme/tetratricopeptide (TPR) repeat protein
MARKPRKSTTSKKDPPESKARWAFAAMAVAVLAALAYFLFQERRPSAPWNVLLVSIDTLRADHLSCYGSRDVRTPHLDRLAAEGILFERVLTVAPTTLPAHASLFTGVIPPVHGVRDNVGFYLKEGTNTLAARLRSEGYDTAAFVGSFVLDSRFGIDQGFSLYDDDLGLPSERDDDGFVAQRRGDEVLSRALDWLASRAPRNEPRPFFAFVHFYDPHTPYDPPQPFAPASSDEALRYGGEVAFVDSLVGRLLDALAASGLDERTLVAITSDHGEMLGEHGELTHGFFLYEAALRIPLLLRYPGGPAGLRVSGAARIVDVAPTLLDLLRLDPIEDSDGKSLVARIRGEAPPEGSPVYAETFLPRLHYGWSELRSMTLGNDKLIRAPRPELYDLAADPDETKNLVAEKAARADELEAILEGIIARERTEPAPGTPDEETRRRLRSLGYAGGGSSAAGPEAPADPKDRVDLYRVLNDPELQSVGPEDGPRFEAALSKLRDILESDPGVDRSYLLYSELLLKAGRARDAERVFAELVARNGDSFEGSYGLGVARLQLRSFDAAAEALGRAAALEPKNAKSYLRLSEVEEGRGDLDAAETWLRRAIAIAPDPLLQDRLADLLLRAGRTEEARAILVTLQRENEDDPVAAYNLGQLLLVEGKPEEAIAMLRRAAALSPNDPDVYQALGNALSAQSKTEEAVASFREAIALAPCLASAHGNLGVALAQLGRLEEARQSFQKAASCDPGYGFAFKNLAAVELQLGSVDAAIEAMRRAVAADPEDAGLRSTLAELERGRRR